MKRILLITLLFAAAGLAATWDGTKGNITVKTTGGRDSTSIACSSADTSVTGFVVIIIERAPGQLVSQTEMVVTSSVAVFRVPEPNILHVIVTEVHAGQTQTFSSTGQ